MEQRGFDLMPKGAFGHAFIEPRLSLQTILHYSITNYCPSRKLHVYDHNKIQLILAKFTTYYLHPTKNPQEKG